MSLDMFEMLPENNSDLWKNCPRYVVWNSARSVRLLDLDLLIEIDLDRNKVKSCPDLVLEYLHTLRSPSLSGIQTFLSRTNLTKETNWKPTTPSFWKSSKNPLRPYYIARVSRWMHEALGAPPDISFKDYVGGFLWDLNRCVGDADSDEIRSGIMAYLISLDRFLEGSAVEPVWFLRAQLVCKLDLPAQLQDRFDLLRSCGSGPIYDTPPLSFRKWGWTTETVFVKIQLPCPPRLLTPNFEEIMASSYHHFCYVSNEQEVKVNLRQTKPHLFPTL